jgi:hypothetical protein
MWHKEAQNLDFSGINSSSSSFIPFSTSVLSSQLNRVGISLGRNVHEINVSANVLKHMEYDLLKVSPKLQNIVNTTNLDIEDAIATVDSKHLSNLIGYVS